MLNWRCRVALGFQDQREKFILSVPFCPSQNLSSFAVFLTVNFQLSSYPSDYYILGFSSHWLQWVESCSPPQKKGKIHVYTETVNVALFINRGFVDVIKLQSYKLRTYCLSNCETINFCYFKPLSFWQGIMAVLGNYHTDSSLASPSPQQSITNIYSIH